ncbi:MAG: hypothetical protein AB6733_16330 [Clostridiaceae bacterium]
MINKGRLNIIIKENKRLYPAEVLEVEGTEIIRPLFDVEDILETIKKRHRVLIKSNQFDYKGNKLEDFYGNLDEEEIYALYMEESNTNLDEVVTLSQASSEWGLSEDEVVQAIRDEKFHSHEIKDNEDGVFTNYRATERVFGAKNNDFIIYYDFEIFINRKGSLIWQAHYKKKILDIIDKNKKSNYLGVEKSYKSMVNEYEQAYDYVKDILLNALKAIRVKRRVIIIDKLKDKENIKRVLENEKEFFLYIESYYSKRIMTPERINELIDYLRRN